MTLELLFTIFAIIGVLASILFIYSLSKRRRIAHRVTREEVPWATRRQPTQRRRGPTHKVRIITNEPHPNPTTVKTTVKTTGRSSTKSVTVGSVNQSKTSNKAGYCMICGKQISKTDLSFGATYQCQCGRSIYHKNCVSWARAKNKLRCSECQMLLPKLKSKRGR